MPTSKQVGRAFVSDEHRFVYFETPKVACTSIKAALLPLLSEVNEVDATLRGSPHKALRQTAHQRTLQEVARSLRRGKLEGYLRFSFVRNPWDRLYSCYNSKIRRPRLLLDKTDYRGGELYRGMPFREFVQVVCDTPDTDADIHFRSQYDFLREPAGSIFSAYVRRLIGSSEGQMLTNYIGRFENLKTDFKIVADRLELGTLPHMNPSARKDYRGAYTPEMRDAVGERYATDVKTFEYRF